MQIIQINRRQLPARWDILPRLASLAMALVLLMPWGRANSDNASNQLSVYLQDLETLCADFEQAILNQFGEELEKSSGRLYLHRPGKFHWAYQQPYVQYLVSDGLNLWVYDEDLEQVTIRDIANVMDSSPAAILGGDIDIDAHYIVIELDRDGESSLLELTPRDDESEYVAIRLGFERNQLVKMVLFDSLGQTTQISLSSIERNPALDEALFHFEPPAGVDIIDTRQQP